MSATSALQLDLDPKPFCMACWIPVRVRAHVRCYLLGPLRMWARTLTGIREVPAVMQAT